MEGFEEIVKKLRTNENIRAKDVRLVGEKGEQLGIMPLYQAREVAKKDSLDLVEVAPTAVPPVCRLMDYGRFRFEQTKKEREAKRSQKVSLLREVRLRPKIGAHDFAAKVRTVKKLLEEGNKVKTTVLFRGREITHPELALGLLQKIVDSFEEEVTLEGRPAIYGRRMNVVLVPTAKMKARVKEKVQEGQNAQT